MIPQSLNQISAKNINDLLIEGRVEDRTIEYKSTLPGAAESEKIPRLLKPVCSFANTDGGDLLLGVSEQRGRLTAIEGVESDNPDKTTLALLHMCQNGIEPQVGGIQIKPVLVNLNRYVFIVRVPKSWIGPHRVQSNAKFYARSSGGAYELDVPQLRQAFGFAASLQEKITDFRTDRIGLFLGEGAPAPLVEGVRVVLHLIPLMSIASTASYSVPQYQAVSQDLIPAVGGSDYYLNFDGIVVVSGRSENGYRAYTQFFRSGIIEFVHVYEPRDNRRFLPSAAYERTLLRCYQQGVKIYRQFQAAPPVYAFLTLIRAKGYYLGVSQEMAFWNGQPREVDRDVLLIPNVEIVSLDQQPTAILRPMFNMVWNAGGYSRSLNFNDNGDWVGQGLRPS
jgi:hypothetical protein